MNANLIRYPVLALAACLVTSCTTAYDEYGRPVQVVDPGTAALGAVAAGAVGYGIASHRDHHRHYDRHDRHYHNRYYHRGSRRHYRHHHH